MWPEKVDVRYLVGKIDLDPHNGSKYKFVELAR